jgi:5-methylcytosine-specific restriction endonuclease McrA
MPLVRNQRPAVATLDVRIARLGPKAADPHYLTPEHRAWRAEVLRRAGGVCQQPRCTCGNTPGKRLFADHIVELRDGGAALDPTNGRALCGAAHSKKTAASRARRMATPT